MPVEEDVNLDNPDGLTQEDLDILKRQAEELALLAEDAEKNADKINKSKKSMEGLNFAQLNLLSEGPTEGVSGEPLSQDKLTDIIVDILKEMKEAEKERRENAKAIAEMRSMSEQIQSSMATGFGKIQEGFSFSKSPVGFMRGKAMQFIGKAGIAGAIAAMVIQQVESIYNQIITQVKDMYKAGGALDVRKDQLDSLRQVSSLQSVIDMEQGRVFFTSDTGEILRQGVPQATNTMGRINGYKQYLQEFER